MKKTLLTIAAILALASPAAIRAQITNTVTTQTHDPSFSMGRDFWFTEQSNQWDMPEGKKYIYVSSVTDGNAYIQNGSHLAPIAISPNAFLPVELNSSGATEMESSGIVENKVFHVWSPNTDLIIYYLNDVDNSTEGEYIIPTIGWGTDYVVAAYESFFNRALGAWDLPSTMAVVANEDSTTVTITPSCNCRKDTIGNENGDSLSSIIVFPAHVPHTWILNRGQSLQLMPVKATGDSGFDMTGTLVHANRPVGVFGGASAAIIPSQFSYANHVEEMIPPIHSWGKTYYTTNFLPQPDTLPKHDSAMYLFIASLPHQTIYRSECGSGADTECSISKQNGLFWKEEAHTQKFWSDEPFLCVEYSNSGLFPDSLNGQSAPSEVVITPRERFTKSVLFDGNDFENYATVIVNIADAGKTLLDGQHISSFHSQCLDSNWELFALNSVYGGFHSISGDDSGVGVSLYENGSDEVFSWSSPSFEGTLQSPDTTAPSVDTMTACNQAFIHLSDSGLLPDSIHTQSGISEIEMDSDYNMDFLFNLNFIAGIGVDTTSYAMSVEDITKPAYLRVNVFDMAGNKTVITSTYKSMYDSITPYIHDLGGWEGGASNIGYDTIFNKGEVPFPLDELHLTNDSAGFVIFDSIGGPPDLSPIPVGNRRIIQIQLDSISQYETVDTILAGNSCDSVRAILTGFGGISNFIVSNGEWEEMLPAPDTGYVRGVRIVNYLPHSLTIDSARWSDTTHFKAITKLPLNVSAAPGQSIFEIAYFPDLNSLLHQDATQGSWYSHNVLQSDGVTPSPRYDSLIGWALAPSGVQNSYSPSLQASIIPTNNGRSLEIILPTNLTAPAHFELVNVLGQNVLGTTLGTQIETIDASALPRGVYFYRITLGSMNQMGKVILGQ